MPDFNALLQKNVGEVERPKPFPVGTYSLTVLRSEFGESSQKKTPYVRFHFRATGYDTDVDAEMLPPNWQERELRRDFYLTDDALFMLSDFLQILGLSGMPMDQAIARAPGAQVKGYVTQRPNQNDPTRVFNDVENFATIA